MAEPVSEKIGQYRTKPRAVEAVLWLGVPKEGEALFGHVVTIEELEAWGVYVDKSKLLENDEGTIWIGELGMEEAVLNGWWIVKDPDGEHEFWPEPPEKMLKWFVPLNFNFHKPYRTEQRDFITWIVCNYCEQAMKMGGDDIQHIVDCEVVPEGGTEKKTATARAKAFARLTAPEPPEPPAVVPLPDGFCSKCQKFSVLPNSCDECGGDLAISHTVEGAPTLTPGHSLADIIAKPSPIPIPPDFPGQTLWNGRPCEARVVFVRVGKAPRSTWWSVPFEGQIREAVEVTQDGETFYIDNGALPAVHGQAESKSGDGWRKVTIGRGLSGIGHRSMPIAEVLGEAGTAGVPPAPAPSIEDDDLPF
jgi:hypothetical protein